MSKERKRKSKKEVRIRMVLGIAFGLGMFFALGIAAFIQGRGGTPNFFVVMGSFLLCGALSLILLLSIFQDAVDWEIEEKQEKYSKQPLTRLPNLSRERLDEVLQAAGFQQKDGAWYSRRFSWAKAGCILHYYAYCATTEEDMERILWLDAPRLASKNLCLFLFLCREQVTPEDETYLRGHATSFILDETVVPTQGRIHTCIPVLLDETGGEGWLLELSKGISVYAHGCKFLRKLFH